MNSIQLLLCISIYTFPRIPLKCFLINDSVDRTDAPVNWCSLCALENIFLMFFFSFNFYAFSVLITGAEHVYDALSTCYHFGHFIPVQYRLGLLPYAIELMPVKGGNLANTRNKGWGNRGGKGMEDGETYRYVFVFMHLYLFFLTRNTPCHKFI